MPEFCHKDACFVTEINFNGRIVKLDKRECRECAKSRLKLVSTSCDSCKKPILPGDQYVWIGKNLGTPYAHAAPECAQGQTEIKIWDEEKGRNLHRSSTPII